MSQKKLQVNFTLGLLRKVRFGVYIGKVDDYQKARHGIWELHPKITTWGMSQPHFGLSVRVKPTLPKVGTWSPPGLPKTQKMI